MKTIAPARLCLCFLGVVLASFHGIAASSPKADRVVVIKHERKLTLMHAGAVLKTYSVALGTVPLGAKDRQGDHRTPEGVYVLDSRNDHSHFYKAIHISYPNADDRKRAARLDVTPGGDLFIHGLPNDMDSSGLLTACTTGPMVYRRHQQRDGRDLGAKGGNSSRSSTSLRLVAMTTLMRE